MARGRASSGGRAAEFLGLVAFALAILITVSLLSFDPLDRSFFSAPSALRGATRNLAGTAGANLAYALYVALGLLAWSAPLVLVGFGVSKLRSSAGNFKPSRLAGAALLWLSVSALLAVTLVEVRFHGSDAGIVRIVPIPAGGVVGTALAALLGDWLNETGSLIVLLTMMASALLLATPVSYARVLDGFLGRASKLRARLASGWQRFQERRRKARERARVLARDDAAREREERTRRDAEARRAAAEADARARAAAAEAKSREKSDREREKAEREREKLERDRLERERKESEIAAVARQATAGKRSEAPGARAAATADGAKLAPAAEALLLAARPSSGRGRGEAPPPVGGAAAEPRPALAREAERSLARDAAARAAAVTLRLEEGAAAGARADATESARPAPAPAPPSLPAAALPAASAPASASPRLPSETTERSAGGAAVAPTPRDVTALAAEAKEAMRRAREAKAEADARKKPTQKEARSAAEFALPPVSLLQTVNNDAVVTERELVENAKVLVSKLKEFFVDGTVQAIHPGPVVTTYEYRPEAGVKYSKIVGLADDLCLAMKAEGVRIDRISGKSAVGIEVPNSARETIGLREILETDEFQKSTSKLTLALGKSINGETYVTDLRKMPHLLVAGATGSGKSVSVNCMIVSVLYKATPDEVRFIMVDPKRIELGVYDGIPHLLVPVVTDCRLASNALRWAVVEMENRYKRLAATGVRSLEQFNAYLKGPEARKLAENLPPEELEPLPYIVILIDELADLMMVAANDVEDSISRLAAMARAVGIHLVLATQRPSVDVITGVIKANFPSRIAFRVSSKVDSRTILDSNGAEMLLGKGDMLFMPPGSARLQRVHGAFISDGEVQRLVNYLKNQGEPRYRDDVLRSEETASEEFEGEIDEMYEEAVRVVLETGQASVSHLQRRLRLGYGRAARLVDMMELNGLVGPSQGAKGREILVDRAGYLAQMSAPR